MAQTDRDAATILALKIALEQAADLLESHADEIDHEWGDGTPSDTGIAAELRATAARYRAMSRDEWEALPIELTGPSGAA